jgi:cytochrome c oxidase assembly protein subunit 15
VRLPAQPVSPERYRRVVAVAGVSLAAIVLTGAAVRLTEAGLGCENWPACSEERFVPEWQFHAWVEFGNRLISGVVSVLVGLAVLTAYWRRPRRRDLVRWAWGLVAGVAAQVVLGGVTVRVDLHPALVGSHYLLSMVLLWAAVVLWVRAGPSAAPGTAEATIQVVPAAPRGVVAHSRVVFALAAAVLVTGTLVTGTGPNSGDSRAARLSFDLDAISQIHSATVWCFAAAALLLVVRLHRVRPQAARAGRWLLVATVAQGAIGYVQYALGVPPALVELHILGSLAVWCAAVLVHLQLFDRHPVPAQEPATVERRLAPKFAQSSG